MESLGFIESKGYVPFFSVADAMVKAANVEIIKKVGIGAGQVTIIVKGDISAIKAAIDAGVLIANKYNGLVGSYIIARPTEEILSFILK